jgi:ApbE superfamily uncharacterized protein (UPF0280 family)
MTIRAKRSSRFIDVPVQDVTLRIAGPEDLYEQARAVGMSFWEQIQSYAVRNKAFATSKGPLELPEDSPILVREMAVLAASAGVGPMFTFQGALTDFVGRTLGGGQHELTVVCGGDHFLHVRHRSRISVRPPDGVRPAIGVVVSPELGPQGLYSSVGAGPGAVGYLGPGDGIAVLATSCILADAAAAAAAAMLRRRDSLREALAYLQRIRGVHGAVLVRGEHLGVAGALELAA